MVTIFSEKKLKDLVREGVREALGAELMKLRALALSDVSAREQEDIEKRYGTPSRHPAKSFPAKV